MRCVRILSFTWWIPKFLLTGFLLIPVDAQIAGKPVTREQTSFSMEFPFEKPVTLSEAAKKTLATDRSIADVMRDEQLSIAGIPPKLVSSVRGPPRTEKRN